MMEVIDGVQIVHAGLKNNPAGSRTRYQTSLDSSSGNHEDLLCVSEQSRLKLQTDAATLLSVLP